MRPPWYIGWWRITVRCCWLVGWYVLYGRCFPTRGSVGKWRCLRGTFTVIKGISLLDEARAPTFTFFVNEGQEKFDSVFTSRHYGLKQIFLNFPLKITTALRLKEGKKLPSSTNFPHKSGDHARISTRLGPFWVRICLVHSYFPPNICFHMRYVALSALWVFDNHKW